MRKSVHVLFFTIITILMVNHVNFASAADATKTDLSISIEELKKALEYEPSNVDMHYSLGLAYHDKGIVSEAISALNKAFEINSEDFKILNSLAITLHEKGKIEDTIFTYENIAAITPKDANIRITWVLPIIRQVC